MQQEAASNQLLVDHVQRGRESGPFPILLTPRTPQYDGVVDTILDAQ